MREPYEQDPIIFNMEAQGSAPTAEQAQQYYQDNIERFFGNSTQDPALDESNVSLESIELMQ